MKRKIIRIFTFVMAIVLFISCPLSVYASEKWEGSLGLTLYYNKDKILQYIKDTGEFWLYGASQIGAIVKSDFVQFAENKKKMDDILAEGSNIGVYVNENDEMKGLYFSKEFMTQLKALLDQYAKEHEPYFMVQTYPLNYLDITHFKDHKNVYDTLVNLLEDSPSGVIAFGSNGGTMCFTDLGQWFTRVSPVNEGCINTAWNEVTFYNNEEWNKLTFRVWRVSLSSEDSPIKTMTEFSEKAGNNYIQSGSMYCEISNHFKTILLDQISTSNYYIGASGSTYDNLAVITKTARRIRVFNTFGDFQNYTLGKRSVYYTSKYYDYVPEDLTVLIDDLQKEIDDLSKVIDELLKQITKETDESEIEELLRLILEELRKQQSTGGGGGGTGDVTVNVDMKDTNSWLSKIYNKVSEISGKISSSAGQSLSEVVESIENLQKMLNKYLSEITGDLDDIKGQLEEMSEQEFTEKTGDFLDDTMADFIEIGEKAKGKFPFSIPNDIRLLISKMSVSQPENPGQGTYSVQTISFDTTYESNGLISVMDEGVGDVPVISETGAPIFYIPFVIASAGIEQYVLIDLSGFESISSFCRSLMTIYFIICLFNLTFKVMGLWGDLVD